MRYNQIMLRRNYFTLSDVSGATEAQAALAEALLDDYVGFQERFYQHNTRGEVTAVSNSDKTIHDTGSGSQLQQTNNFFAGMVLEIIGGTGKGQVGIIESSDRDDRTITLAAALSTVPDTTSVFRIYQLAKFPRRKDVDTNRAGDTYYKSIPQAIKEAAIAQCEFVIAQGDDYFTGDDSEMDSESIMSYSYSRGGNAGQAAVVKFMSPKARTLLRGYKNRTGRLVRGGPDVT